MVSDWSSIAADGKAVLAQYSGEKTHSIVKYLKSKHPEFEVPDMDTYVAQMREVQEKGYATTIDENPTAGAHLIDDPP